MTRKSTLQLIRIAVTTALLLYVFNKAGLLSAQGWQDLWQILAQANRWLIFLSLALVPFSALISAVKWYYLARACDMSVSLWRLFAYYVVGSFFNLVLPSSIGGDVIRVHELGRYTGRYADSAAVVFVERFSGLATLVFLAALAVIVNLKMFNLPWLTTGLLVGLLGVAFICWIIIDERPFKFMNKVVGKKLPLIAKLMNKLGKFRQAVLIYQDKPGALWLAIFNSLLFYLFAIVSVWISALAFDSSVDFVSMLVAVPVILFIMNIPLSIGGIGLMEFAFSFTFVLLGINSTVAVSTALLVRLKSLITAGMGSLIYPMVSDGRTVPQLTKSIRHPYEDNSTS